MIALFAGAAWLTHRQLHALGLPHAWVLASLLALGVTLSLGSLQGVWQAWRRRGEPESAALRDGTLVRLSGELQAEGRPVLAPFSGREALFVRYAGSAAEADGDDVGTRRPHWRGLRSTPCRLRSRVGVLSLRGFPSLGAVAEQQFSGAAHHPAAAQVLAETAWQLAPELPAFDLQSAAQAWAIGTVDLINPQALQRLQMEVGRSTPAEVLRRLPERPWVFRERVVPPGVPVTVVGTWRAAQAVLDVGCGPQSPAHEIVLGDAAALARRQFAVALGFATGLWALTLAGYGVVMVERGAWVRAALAAMGALP